MSKHEPFSELTERMETGLAFSVPELAKYPSFLLYHLGGGRFTAISRGLHVGAGMGAIEGDELHLYGVENFRINGGLAWGMNYEQHQRIDISAIVRRARTEQVQRKGPVR